MKKVLLCIIIISITLFGYELYMRSSKHERPFSTQTIEVKEKTPGGCFGLGRCP